MPAGASTPPCLTSFSTPTIVNHGRSVAEARFEPLADRIAVLEEPA